MLDANPDWLVQVLGNLVHNALRHTPSGGQGSERPIGEVRRKRGRAAGGGYSTTTDWLRFQEVFADGCLLSPEMGNLFLSGFETTENIRDDREHSRRPRTRRSR